MSETEGKLLTCDLCGATVFLKFTGHGETDGGYTRWREYEKPPEGWSNIHVGKVVYSTLCPSCNERIQEALLACVNGIREGA